ncbi:MAG: alanine--glyoxylate aminotransferase family protein [Myxococcota bacterium]
MTPLLMIPGPVELSPAVRASLEIRPAAHTAPAFIRTFGEALRDLRTVFQAGADHQPFVVAGSGTLAMEMAATNVVGPGDRALVIETGYFSARMAEILRRRGVVVTVLAAEPGHAPSPAEVVAALDAAPNAVFVTHVDTSTGVRVDLAGIAAAVRPSGALLVVDGVCSVAGEAAGQTALGIDVLLTASQKALSLPPGLAIVVASPRALAARARLTAPPPLTVDFDQWLPVHRAYEEGRPSYFATPATGLVATLAVGLAELVAEGVDAAIGRHVRAARAIRAGFDVLGLRGVPVDAGLAANTLSALWLPPGVGPDLPARLADRGVVVAGGLHPAIRPRYFRIGHLGWVTSQPEALARTVRALGDALEAAGYPCDPHRAEAAVRSAD